MENEIILKPLEQNLTIINKGKKLKIQFNFCPECRYFEDCYDNNSNNVPNYISPECFDEGKSLGYDV